MNFNCKLKLMKTLIYVLALLLFCFSCNKKRTTDKKKVTDNYKSSKYSFRKIEYKKQDESFDSTFVMKGNKVRLSCNTECFNDFSITDTINDSIINLGNYISVGTKLRKYLGSKIGRIL